MGRAKLALPFGAETMLQRTLRILEAVVSPIVVVAARQQELPPMPDHVLVARDEREDLGPLEGLATGLSTLRAKVDAAYASSCDVPFLKPDFVRWMIEALGDHDLVVPRDGRYHHPLAAVYRTRLEDKVRALIDAERMRPVFLIEECDARVIDVDALRKVDPGLNSLRNVNTPEEYQVALRDAGFAKSPRHDVRMRGFAERVVVETALAWVDSQARALTTETVELDASCGRVLSDDVTAPIDVPPFDRSAMDGYALRGAATDGAGSYNRLQFRIIGESLPGGPFSGNVSSGAAVRIMTGAPLPSGADAVLPAEFATESEGLVEITTAVAPGKHVGRRGEDISAGTCLLKAGRQLRPQDVGLLASVGVGRVDVVRRPRVRLLVTGNELAAPGQPCGEFQIFDSNSSMLRGLVERDGGALESRIHATDTRDAIREAMLRPGADVILVSGGSSVGAEDHSPTILAEEGELAIHGIAMRPSSPSGMGRIGETLVFLLPGNPVSCLCAYDFFAGRAIRRLGGRRPDWPYASRQARVRRKIVSAIGRVDYCRVSIVEDGVEPLSLSGASILSSTTRADGFVIVPAELEGYAPGSVVNVFHYDSFPPVQEDVTHCEQH